MKKRMVVLAAASTAGAVVSPVVQTPQVASADAASCPSGHMCAWPLTQYGGTEHQWFNSSSWWGQTIWRTDSSWFNNSSQNNYVGVYGFYQGSEYPTVCLAPGQKVASDFTYDNQGERHQFASSASSACNR
jgi:hypothetical protein